MFTEEGSKNIPHKGASLYPSIPTFEITTQGIYNILSNCNPYKSPGPDSIHPYALKVTAAEVSPMLTQQSLDSGIVPIQWKHAYVSPVFKKEANLTQKTIGQFHLPQWSVNLWNT